ncbi:MAG TPA: ABC transporter substrate-binding protein [Candidatus Aquilonibacter sp.]|nr:ABC transporter substrate-binding protein [Candidatus Aquilonibacter sp.]
MSGSHQYGFDSRASNRRLRRLALASALAVVLLIPSMLLTSCNPYSKSAAPRTLNFLIESAPINLDPRFSYDAQAQNIDGLIFSSLVAHDNNMDIVPDLAESWEMKDPLTFVFHLRPGVKFHDGRPLTSADVKYTFDSVLNGVPSPGGGTVRSTKRSAFDYIASVDAPDPLTAVFHLKKPRASFLWDISRPAIGIVPQGSGTDIRYHPIGSGPFRFVSMTTDEEVDLDRNPDYFGGAPAPAGSAGGPVEHIRFRVVPDAVVRALELRKGSADVGGVNSLIPDMVVALKKEKELTVDDEPGTALTYVAFNLSDPILAHREVRLALDYATDRATIIRYLLHGEARIAVGVLPPNSWANDPNLQPRPYDPAEAERLLDQAGSPRGPDGIRMHLTLKTTTDEAPRLLGEALANQWRKVGIVLELRPLESATFFSDINHGSFQMYTLRWLGGNNDPSFFQFVFSSANMPPNGYNRGHYSNPAVDALIAQETTEMDHERRKALDWQIQQILYNDDPYLNLWFNDTVCVYRDRVEDVRVDSSGDYDFLDNVVLR